MEHIGIGRRGVNRLDGMDGFNDYGLIVDMHGCVEYLVYGSSLFSSAVLTILFLHSSLEVEVFNDSGMPIASPFR